MAPDDQPSVSVILPVYNETRDLRTALDTLVSQTYPNDRYEVVVVDNGSEDDTVAVAEAFAAAHRSLVTVESETSVRSSYAARNTGLSVSTGDVVAFVDADVRVDADWLERGIDRLFEADADYMGCAVDVDGDDRTLVETFDTLTGFPVERYVEEGQFAPTCGLFVRREVFRDAGTFDERLVSGGDAEFGHRVAAAGYELHYAESVSVSHPARATLRPFVEKHVRVGRGILQRRRWHSDSRPVSLFVHPALYLPPNPIRFHRHFGSDWRELSAVDKVGLFLIAYVETLARTVGKVRAFGSMLREGIGAPATGDLEEAAAGQED